MGQKDDFDATVAETAEGTTQAEDMAVKLGAKKAAEDLQESAKKAALAGVQNGNVPGAAQAVNNAFKQDDALDAEKSASPNAPQPGKKKDKKLADKVEKGDTFAKKMTQNVAEWMDLVQHHRNKFINAVKNLATAKTPGQTAAALADVAKAEPPSDKDLSKMSKKEKQTWTQGVNKMAELTKKGTADFEANPTQQVGGQDEPDDDADLTAGSRPDADPDEGTLTFNASGDGKGASIRYVPPAHDEDEDFDEDFDDDAAFSALETVGEDEQQEVEADKDVAPKPNVGVEQDEDLGSSFNPGGMSKE